MNLTADVIQGFVGSVLSKRFDDSVKSPDFHRELWELACDPHPYVSVAAPRGHAKSTAGTLAFGLCSLLFRSSRYLVIVSDTEAQAAMFVGAMKQELSDNEQIIELFGLQKDEKGQVKFLKDTEVDVIVACEDGHMFRIQGKGAEQKLRGMIWNGARPDLIIVDDLENDELVMNKDRREKLKRWFKGALMPSLAAKGRIRMWGTILHMDSVLENTMPSENDKYTRETELKLFSVNPRRQLWKGVKFRAHNEDFSEILWPERFNKDFFTLRREEAIKDGMGDIYSQEYLNRPIDDAVAFFKKADLVADNPDKVPPMLYYCTADLAISQKERADYSVFIIGGVDPEKKIHITQVIRDRLDGKEIVDLMLAIQRTYDIQAFGVEEMQVSKALGPFLREEMIKNNTYLSLVPMTHGGKDKVQRARGIQARVRAKTVLFPKDEDWYPTFEDEILKFPRGKHDDQVDAFAYFGLLLDKMIESPTEKEIEEEEYFDEYARTGTDDGRNRITGY